MTSDETKTWLESLSRWLEAVATWIGEFFKNLQDFVWWVVCTILNYTFAQVMIFIGPDGLIEPPDWWANIDPEVFDTVMAYVMLCFPVDQAILAFGVWFQFAVAIWAVYLILKLIPWVG